MKFNKFMLMIFLVLILRPSIGLGSSLISNYPANMSNSWETRISPRVSEWLPDAAIRHKILTTVFREATLAGIEPELVLSVIVVESRFDKYALSKAGAVGLMQIMPFWLKELKPSSDNLFDIETNIRLGCRILKNYLDIEKGDVFYALGRYNGSRGQGKYPQLVLSNYQKFHSLI